jgi:hypothetical protein
MPDHDLIFIQEVRMSHAVFLLQLGMQDITAEESKQRSNEAGHGECEERDRLFDLEKGILTCHSSAG